MNDKLEPVLPDNFDPTDIPDDCIDVTTMGDKEVMVLTPQGERVPLRALQQASTPQTPRSWMDMDSEALQNAMALRKANRDALLEWIRSSLVEGIDYGRIHIVRNCDDKKNCRNPQHLSKPSLWKAGAEKIAAMLGMRVEWPGLIDEIETIKQGASIIVLRCELIDQNGNVVSEGVGARTLDQDYNDINKALKMAKKSSMIDAVLNAAGLSEVFTQDLMDDDTQGSNIVTLTDDGQEYLFSIAKEYYGEDALPVLKSLARRRFNIVDGDWTKIPDGRLGDAVRSLKDKANA